MGGGWSKPRPGRFTPGRDMVSIVQEDGWAPGQVRTGAEKSRLPPGLDPRPVQPVASRYTHYAIPALDVRGLSGKYQAILNISRTGRVALM